MSQRTLERFFKRPASSMASAVVEREDAGAEELGSLVKVRKVEAGESVVAVGELSSEQLERIEKNRSEAKARLLNKNRTMAGQPMADMTSIFDSLVSKTELGDLLEASWCKILKTYMSSLQFKQLAEFVTKERKTKKIFPPEKDIFSAFHASTFSAVKVVILGQDPYHNDRQAHGMCFSVQHGVPPPPSLINVFKELETDIATFKRPRHGCLQKWADQGVLLLNSVLTVEAHQAGSHSKKGWERFTDEVIVQLSNRKSGVVFLLWGRYAQDKGKRIDRKKHHVLTAAHPSPMASMRGGWFGCHHFSKTNEFLRREGKKEIDWTL